MPRLPFGSTALAGPALNTALDDVRMTAVQFTDVIINNETDLKFSPDLTLPLEANAWYTFESLLIYDSSTAADLLVLFSGPGGTFWGLSRWFATPSATTVTNQIDLQMQTAITKISLAMGAAGVGTLITARAAGYLVTQETAGNLTVLFVQNPPDPTNTTLRQGSWISLSRVF